MKNAEIKVEDSKMIVALSGRVDASNSGDIQKLIDEALGSNSGVKKMVVDAADLAYISSAGLRVLLSCKKKLNDFAIINVSRDVYDILEMTGFVSILEVKKALRELSIDGLEMIGQGTCGKVYRMDDETIVKVFNEGFDMSKIESERENSQKSFINGIDTAISYDVVKVGNQVGVVYENMAAYVYAELCATYFFTNNEEGFLDAALKGISLKSIDCANFYISYLYEKDRIQEAKVVFDDIFFKEYEKSTNMHFPTYFVTTESALRFIYKGFLNTGKYDLAKEYLIKNREFIEQSKNELNKTNYYSLYNEINEKSFIELEKYEGNNLIDLDYSPLYSVFDENIIEKMPNKVKQFIVTSMEVFNFLSTHFNNLDYSSAVMPIMRCLESLLYNIIGKSFIPYLKEELEQGRLDFDELPQELVVRSRVTGKKVFIGNPDWVTLGNALTWTSYNIRGNNYPNDLFLDYCYEYLDNDYEKTAQQFIDGLRNIKPKRNKAAHTEVVTFEDAKECNDYLLTVNKFIAFLINNFSFCITKEEK